jgi:hypothetical protein
LPARIRLSEAAVFAETRFESNYLQRLDRRRAWQQVFYFLPESEDIDL